MKTRRSLVRSALVVLGVVLAVAAVSAIALYADVQRIGCESAGQLLGPASSDGFAVANVTQPGACFVSLVAIKDRDLGISRVLCTDQVTFATCQEFRKQASSTWSNFFGSRCTSISFVGGARCDCTTTKEGCQAGQWPVEVQP